MGCTDVIDHVIGQPELGQIVVEPAIGVPWIFIVPMRHRRTGLGRHERTGEGIDALDGGNGSVTKSRNAT